MPDRHMLSAEDHLGIVDTLYRFAAGQDDRDAALFRSAFTDDAVLDFTQPARKLGVDLPPFAGGDALAAAIMEATSDLTTTHSVTNARIVGHNGSEAILVALVEAQHLSAADHSRRLMLKNRFVATVVRRAGGWAIRRLVIENIWRDGEAGVLFPQAG